MKRLLLTAIVGLISVSPSMAEVLTTESLQYAGNYTVDMVTGQTVFESAGGPRFVGDIYSNFASAPNQGISSTALSTIWGDEATAIDTGTLSEFGVSVFNSATGNTLPVTTLDIAIGISRADTSFIGGFTGTINFGAGLNPGFFSTVTFINLEGLGIDIDTTALRIEQQRLAHTGGSLRLGVASLNPVTIGSSPDAMLVNGVATAFAAPAHPAYRLSVIPEPASLALLGLAGLMGLRRR